MRVDHLDKPGVRQYFEKLPRKRSLKSITSPPQLSSFSAPLKQAQSATSTYEMLDMADFESISIQTGITQSVTSRI
jgi:hypothetical protein